MAGAAWTRSACSLSQPVTTRPASPPTARPPTRPVAPGWHLLVLVFLASLFGCALRGYARGDVRYAWGMFAYEVHYQLDYMWLMADGTRVPHDPGPDLRGVEQRVQIRNGAQWTSTFYSLPPLRDWIRSYVDYAYRTHAGPDAVALEATLRYQIARGPTRVELIANY